MAKNFGRRLSKDERDKGYLMKRLLAPAGTILPTSKTWRIAAKNLDQGDYGTCVGNGWANFLRCAPIQTTADEAMALKIYDAAIQLDEWADNDNDTDRQMGTSVRAGAEAVTYMERLKSYVWAFSLQPAVEWVLTQGPCVIGVAWYSSMMTPNNEGIISITPRAREVGGHCLLWRGADTRRALATLSNSWGDSWGRNGECYIGFGDLERLILEDGEVCSAIEKKLNAVV